MRYLLRNCLILRNNFKDLFCSGVYIFNFHEMPYLIYFLSSTAAYYAKINIIFKFGSYSFTLFQASANKNIFFTSRTRNCFSGRIVSGPIWPVYCLTTLRRYLLKIIPKSSYITEHITISILPFPFILKVFAEHHTLCFNLYLYNVKFMKSFLL